MSDQLVNFHSSFSADSPVVANSDNIADQPNCAPPRLTCSKVLHIINGEFFSGAERVQQGLGKRLNEFGYQADFVCLKTGKFLETCDLPPDRVFEFPMSSRRDFSVVPRIVQLLFNGNYRLLHAHTPRSAMIAAMVAKRTGTPWVYHVHSPTARDSTRRWINYLNAWTERVALVSCHHLVAVSDSLNREMQRKGWAPQRVTTIHNGVEPLPAIDWQSRPTIAPWHLGMVALMRPRKGVEMLLEAIYILSTRRRDIQVEFIGSFESSGYQSQIQNLVNKWQLESLVHFSGFTRDIPGNLQKLDALVLPSLFGEGLPMVVLEAMAAGLPVVATAVEGTPEAVRDGIDGLLAKARNAGDLAVKIDELCTCRQRWKTMGQSARTRQQTLFTTQQMSRKVANLYNSIVVNQSAS